MLALIQLTYENEGANGLIFLFFFFDHRKNNAVHYGKQHAEYQCMPETFNAETVNDISVNQDNNSVDDKKKYSKCENCSWKSKQDK